MNGVYDVVIIGGGINGCGIAAEAAQRGLSVLLLEQEDLASKTSSNSSNLIHGGLRYLEQYDFSLVKKALDERQTLLNIAPHLVRPMTFMLPYTKGMRPLWLLRSGLFIYDHLSRRNTLPKSRLIRRSKVPKYFMPLQKEFNKGFLYSDAVTHDARLTIENALQAHKYGADIHTRSAFNSAEYQAPHWIIKYTTKDQPLFCKSRCLINAAGPWVNHILEDIHSPITHKIALVKGSHILVPRLYNENYAYMLQHTDNRIIFIVPYHGFTMIGTTDVRLSSIPQQVSISEEEITYLLEICRRYFKQIISKKDIVHQWSGVRPLIEDKTGKAHEITRDYFLDFQTSGGPLLTVYGGKVTTYRQLAVESLNKLHPIFPGLPQSSSHRIPLPGAMGLSQEWSPYYYQQLNGYAWLEPEWLQRLLNTYGTRIEQLLAGCNSLQDMGIHFGHGLFQHEVDWLIKHEWVQCAEDILWRRSKLGLYLSENEQLNLSNYLIQVFSGNHHSAADQFRHPFPQLQ